MIHRHEIPILEFDNKSHGLIILKKSEAKALLFFLFVLNLFLYQIQDI